MKMPDLAAIRKHMENYPTGEQCFWTQDVVDLLGYVETQATLIATLRLRNALAHATADEPPMMNARAAALAERFHETYERLAPDFGYRTREASAKPWADVPDQNKRLMIAVCDVLLREGIA